MVGYARLRELLEYDAEEGAFVWAVSRGFKKRGTPASSRRITIDGTVYEAGRLAWFYTFGRWPGRNIRYLDGDKSNIRLSNLSNQKPGSEKPRRLSACGVRMTRVTTGYQLALVEKNRAPVDLGVYTDYDTAAATQRWILECSESKPAT